MTTDCDAAVGLVARYAHIVGVKPPTLRVRPKMAGCSYNALTHRITLGDALLACDQWQIEVTLAHEVGHALQRRQILKEVVPVLLVLPFSFVVVLVVALILAPEPLVLCGLSATYLVAVVGAMRRFERWFEPRYVEREIEADTVAVALCGAASTINMLQSGPPGRSAEIVARLHALMGQRVADPKYLDHAYGVGSEH